MSERHKHGWLTVVDVGSSGCNQASDVLRSSGIGDPCVRGRSDCVGNEVIPIHDPSSGMAS